MKRPLMRVNQHGQRQPGNEESHSSAQQISVPNLGGKRSLQKSSRAQAPSLETVLRVLGKTLEPGKRFSLDERRLLFFEFKFGTTFDYAMHKDRRGIALLEIILEGGPKISKGDQLVAKKLLKDKFGMDGKIQERVYEDRD